MGHREPHGMYTVSTPLRLMFMQIAWHLGRGAGAENLSNLRLTLRPSAWSSALGGLLLSYGLSSTACVYTHVSP